MNAVDTLQKAIRETFHQEGYSLSSRYLLACSGGADSVSLGAALFSLSIPFDIAHVNYQTRGADSSADQQLVESLAQQWGADCYVKTVESEEWQKGDSFQANAREMRYDFFHELMESYRYYKACLLAHHQNDQAETLLMSLIKGNNFAVMMPMPSSRPGFLRPFLSVTKQTCLDALLEWNIQWREDESNQKNIYLRNNLRNRILPAIAEINPIITEQLVSKSHLYQKQLSLLEALLQPMVEKGSRATKSVRTFSWRDFSTPLVESHLPIILAHVLSNWGFHGYHLWQGAELATAESGRILEYEGLLVKGRKLIQWIRVQDTNSLIEINSKEEIPVKGSCMGRTVSLEVVPPPERFPPSGTTHFMELHNVRFPLVIRPAKTGDRMIPLGMNGSKLLSDVFIDEKFRPAQRQLAIVAEDQEGIIALSDFRISDRVKAGLEASQCLKLVIEEAD